MGIKLGVKDIKSIPGIKEVRGGDKLIWQNHALVNNLDFVNSTAHSIRMSWIGTSSFTYYSIRRNGVEVYRGQDTNFIDYLLFPNNTYEYSVYGHVTKEGVGYGTGVTYPFSTGDIHSTTYSETTAYMNAIGVLNDDTLYYTNTAQEITGKRMWLAFNEIVHLYKLNNVWDNFLFWNPIWGDTWTKRGVNAHNPTTYNITFNNQPNWVVKSIGIKGNGVDTDGTWVDANLGGPLRLENMTGTSSRGIGVTITDNDSADPEVEFGEARTVRTATFIATNVTAYGGAVIALGEDSGGPYIGYPVTTAIGVTSGFVDQGTEHTIKNGELLQTLTTIANPISTISNELVLGCLNEISVRRYYTTKTMSSVFFTLGLTQVIEGMIVNAGIEMWETFIHRRVWSAPTSDLEPTITQPAGNNELLSPNDITTGDWYKLDVTAEQFTDYMKITEVAGSTPHYIYAQSAPQATHICEFHPGMSTANNIYFSFGQQSNIRYGVKIALDTMEVTDLGNNGNSLFDITLEKQMDGWFRIMMKCSSTSGLHDNFTISFSEVDRTSQGKTIIFRNPVAIYNQ